jgi:hypothetical protein
MNCYQCGGVYERESDLLTIFDFYVGKIVVRDTPYYECRNCHDILYTEEMSRAIETERNRRIHELLVQFPLADFVSSSKAASILDISRQALHKHRRIRHGFIYQTKFLGMTLYLKQSVLRFKNTGDGRFPLQWDVYSHPSKYVKHTSMTGIPESYKLSPRLIESINPFLKEKFVNREECIYVK